MILRIKDTLDYLPSNGPKDKRYAKIISPPMIIRIKDELKVSALQWS